MARRTTRSKRIRKCCFKVKILRNRDDEIAAALQLAVLLEVSAYPKPGNVHRTRDFELTRFEHFL
ncbi:triphosphoribosyl-dephospho-CoA synthase, partial [[Eubacterium] cellulosolvens]